MNRYTRFILKIIRERKFYVRFLFSFLIIAVLPYFLTGIITYINVNQAFREEISQNNVKYLKQTITAMDIIVNQIKTSMQQVLVNKAFQRFETFPNGSYYENLNGAIPKKDLTTNYFYQQDKSQAIESMNVFKMSNPYLKTLYFYDHNKGIVLSFHDNAFSQYSLSSFYDKSWLSDLGLLNEAGPLSMRIRNATQADGSVQDVLTVIFNSNDLQNAFVVNIDAGFLNDQIFKKLNDRDSIYIYSQQGKLMFPLNQEGPSAYMNKVRTLALGAEDGSNRTFRFGGKIYLYSVAKSSLLGWTFVKVNDLSQLTSSLYTLKQNIMLSLALLLLLTAAIAFLSANRLYVPIKNLIANLREPYEKMRAAGKKIGNDELQLLGSVFQSTLSQSEAYRRQLSEITPVYKEHLKYQLVRGKGQSLKEIEMKLSTHGLEVEPENLILLVVSMERDLMEMTDQDHPENTQTKFKMGVETERFHWEGRNKFIVETDDDKLAVVLNAHPEESGHISRTAEKLLDILCERTGAYFTIGISNPCKQIHLLPTAYEEATEALKFGLVYGLNQVIQFKDISASSRYIDWMDKQSVIKLISVVKRGSHGEADKILQTLIDSMGRNLHQMHYHTVRSYFLHITSTILNHLQMAGVDILGLQDTDPYCELLGKNSLPEMIEWVKSFVKQAAASASDQMVSKQEHIHRILKIIDRDFTKDLSLNSVASEMKMNPSYVSRLFKQIMGKTFVEYVTELRIKHSMELLVKGDWKVQDVADMVGYHNPYYFIKVFKENIGLTPGEYQKNNR